MVENVKVIYDFHKTILKTHNVNFFPKEVKKMKVPLYE